jgi:ketosteroid isomerase-like protein
MRLYHHLGIPTTVPREGEYYIEAANAHVYDYRHSEYGVEWMRFEPGSTTPDIVKTCPHVAFEVDDLDAALAGKEVIIPPNSPREGVRVAFIVENGAPIELLEYSGSDPAAEILELERAALGRWCQGDPGGFIELAADDIVYFDPFVEQRLNGRDAFVRLMESIRGQVRADRFELVAPRVQACDGMAMLTFDFVSWTGDEESRWHATEVYRRDAGRWKLIQQHWSLTARK